MRSKKAQVAMEFIYVIGIVLFISIILSKVVLNYYEDKRDEENVGAAKDIVLIVENEILLSSKVSPGYIRNFEIPNKINNMDYNITIDGNEIVLNYKSSIFSSNIPNVTGDIIKGKNTIKNVDGKVCLNVESC